MLRGVQRAEEMQGAVGLPKYRALDANRLAYDGVTSTPFHPHPGLDPSHSPPDSRHVTPDVAVHSQSPLGAPVHSWAESTPHYPRLPHTDVGHRQTYRNQSGRTQQSTPLLTASDPPPKPTHSGGIAFSAESMGLFHALDTACVIHWGGGCGPVRNLPQDCTTGV